MTFSKYLRHRLKSTALRNIALSLLPAVAVVGEIASENPYSQMGCELLISKSETDLQHTGTVMFLFALLIPMLETYRFKNRREIDMLYSMPMSRMKLTLANYLSGYIQVAFTGSVTFIGAWLYLAIHTNYYDLRWMPLYYISILIAGLVICSIIIFVFNEGNTVLDGAVFSILWTVAPAVFFEGVLYSLDSYLSDSEVRYFRNIVSSGEMLYLPGSFTVLFSWRINIHRDLSLYDPDYTFIITRIVVWCLVGVLCAFGYFYGMTHRAAERTGEISDSWFGYKLLIPLFEFSLIMNWNYNEILPVFTLAGMFVAYLLYRRSLKFKLPDYIILGIGALLPLLKL